MVYSQARIIRANIRIYIANMDSHRLHKILCLAETETGMYDGGGDGYGTENTPLPTQNFK